MIPAPLLSVEMLRAAGRQPSVPFRVDLPDGDSLLFCRLFRLLPGKRLSGEAVWRGRQVFAKLFVAEGATRHGIREKHGVEALLTHDIPTPGLVAAIQLPDGGYAVLSEFLDGALTLESAITTSSDPAPLLPAMRLLGRLHGAGLIHDDLHFGNFIRHKAQLLLIDGDAVHRARSAGTLLDNLALFLAQLPPVWDELAPDLLAAYGRPVDIAGLRYAVALRRARRLREFLGKTLRNCTKFQVDRSIRRFSALVRDQSEVLQPLLNDIDRTMATGKVLKNGVTCTVANVVAGEQMLVIKRYNLKHWRHAMSRAWRPSRAWHSWQAAHRLAFYGIATPQPLALVEERLGPLRGRAFLVTEHCPGRNLRDSLDPGSEPAPEQQAAIRDLFRSLCAQRITHGDLKASNLLWHDGQVVLIDLDAMVQHRLDSAFIRDWRSDRQRLLRNWPADSVLVRWLDRELPVF